MSFPRITKVETIVPFSVILYIDGQEMKPVPGTWEGVLVSDVEYEISEYSLEDHDNNEEDFDCDDISSDLKKLQEKHSGLTETCQKDVMTAIRQKNSHILENSDLKKSLQNAKKQICELREKVSNNFPPLALFFGDKNGMQSYVINKDGTKANVDFTIAASNSDRDEFSFRNSISVVLRGTVYIFGTWTNRKRVSENLASLQLIP
jgi:hypothetical protein